MDRSYASGAAGSPPSAPGSPSSGYPTASNPGTGAQATKPGPYWYHMIMEELMAVVAAAGITPAQGTLTQLRDALRSAGVFQTPAQFDNSTKVATTEFANSIGLSAAGIVAAGTTQTLTAGAHAGKSINCGAAGATTLTLPLISAMRLGSRIEFFSSNAGAVTILCQGADVINYGPNGTVSSLVLNRGDTLVLEAGYAGIWLAVGGSRQLSGSADFGASLAVNGYQKLPSGLIVQWGAVTGIAYNQAAGATFTFPIVFPNAVLDFVSTGYATTGVTSFANIMPLTLATNGVSSYQASSNMGSGNFGIRWLAIGY